MSCTHGSSNAPWVPHANASLSPREGRCKPSLPSRVTQAPEVEWLWVLGGVEVVPARSAGYAAFITAGYAYAPAAPARLGRLCDPPQPPRLRRLRADPCGVYNTAPPPGTRCSPQQMRRIAHGGHREEGGGEHVRVRGLAGVSIPSRPGPPTCTW